MAKMKDLHIETVNILKEEYVLVHKFGVDVLKQQKGRPLEQRKTLCIAAMRCFNVCHLVHRELLKLGA